MHIPDGFISPVTYLPALGTTAFLWYIASKKIALESDKIAFLSSLSALSFVLMMVAIPLPAGTSAHLSGVPLLAIVFGAWEAFGAISLVLIIEAFIFGEGGVSTLGINVLAIAFIGSFSAHYTHRWIAKKHQNLGLFLGAWVGVNLSALSIALVLGLQPLLASANGEALFFPFELKTTLWAVMMPHLLIGTVEGVVTFSLYRFLNKNFRVLFYER